MVIFKSTSFLMKMGVTQGLIGLCIYIEIAGIVMMVGIFGVVGGYRREEASWVRQVDLTAVALR